MTKIVVIRRKRIYIALIIAAILLLLMLLLFRKKPTSPVSGNSVNVLNQANEYIPGVYKSTLTLGDYSTNLYVYVDKDRVKKINMDNDNTFINTMYPLAEQTIEKINNELATIDYRELANAGSSSETETLILSTINDAINME